MCKIFACVVPSTNAQYFITCNFSSKSRIIQALVGNVLWCMKKILIICSLYVLWYILTPSKKEKTLTFYSLVLLSGLFFCTAFRVKEKKFLVLVVNLLEMAKTTGWAIRAIRNTDFKQFFVKLLHSIKDTFIFNDFCLCQVVSWRNKFQRLMIYTSCLFFHSLTWSLNSFYKVLREVCPVVNLGIFLGPKW